MQYIKENKLAIIMFLIGIMLGLLIMSFKIKERNIPLDKENVILSFKEEDGITSNEYYDLLKNNSGIELLLNMIDTKILSKKYTLDDKDKEEIKREMQEYIQTYQEYYETNESDFYASNGFKDKDDFYNYLVLEEYRKRYLKDYLKEKITSNEINYYYLNDMNNDFEISYIKGKEETLTKILSDLNNGLNTDEIKKKYLSVTFKELGYISFDDALINQDIYNDALNLEENSYTLSLRSINDEYYIIFKGQIKEKDNIEKLRDRIKNKLVDLKIQNDTDRKLYHEALINLRKENKLKFYDTYLENLYNTYLKSVK